MKNKRDWIVVPFFVFFCAYSGVCLQAGDVGIDLGDTGDDLVDADIDLGDCVVDDFSSESVRDFEGCT